MKTSKLISAAAVALGIIAQAHADPVVYLTGSTAFRSTVFASLSSTAGTNSGGVFDSSPAVQYATFGNSSANGGTYMIFHGNIAGSPVYIDCAWSGSEAGIASACNTSLNNVDRNGNTIPLAGSPETWVNVSNVTLTAGGNVVSTNPAANSGLFEGASRGADLSQADTSQAISWTPPTPSLPQTQLQDFGVESIVTFTLTRNVNYAPSNEWLHCSNITLPQLNVLFADGVVPAGFISGNPTDDDFTVYLVGRNLGSGTRMNMLGDSQYGAHKAVQQYSIGFGIEEMPHQAVLVLTNEGDGGYESGGDVAKALAITNNGVANSGSCQQKDPFNGGVGWFAVGYVGPSDALNTGNFGGEPVANWLTVDGVLSSNGAIENGSWWYWGHEHLYGRNGISGTPETVGNLIFKGVSATVALQNFGVNPAGHDAGIQNNLMNVTKPSDVAYPTF
jgi:hypothetical protein